MAFTPEDFYRAYAQAMLTWQRVESALFRVYFNLFENGNLLQAGAAYYCLDSFGAKLRLVDSTARAVLAGDRLVAWKALNNDLVAASRERNYLAHLPGAVIINDDGSLSLVLGRHDFIPLALIRKRKVTYDAGECERLFSEFGRLAASLDAFVVH